MPVAGAVVDGVAPDGVVADGAFGAVVPMLPEDGADIPVPGAVIGAVPVLLPLVLPVLLPAVLPEAGAIALPGPLIAPDDAGVAEEAGITPDLAFCRLWSFSFAVSALSDEEPFLPMPCLPCILW